MPWVLLGIFAILDEKSESVWLIESRVDGDTARLEDLLHPVGQALRVGLLVVDDVDPLPLQLLGHPVGDRRGLGGVARHGAEEVPAPVAVGVAVRERRASRGARDEPELAALVGRRGRDDLLATGGPDDAEQLRVRGERLRDPDGERRVITQLRVAGDDLDLLVLVRLLRVPALDVVLRPANLLVADVGCGAGERRREADRARLAARHRCRAGGRFPRRRLGRSKGG